MAELVRVDALRNERVRKKRANHWLEGMKDGKKARGGLGGSEDSEVGSLVVTGKESGEGPLSFEEKVSAGDSFWEIELMESCRGRLRVHLCKSRNELCLMPLDWESALRPLHYPPALR